ncbi:unnamed protein product, partial [Amoebophrya sp. A25]
VYPSLRVEDCGEESWNTHGVLTLLAYLLPLLEPGIQVEEDQDDDHEAEKIDDRRSRGAALSSS